MKKSKNILPEACYTPKNLTMAEVQKAFKTKETIVGVVKNSIPTGTEVEVRLSEELVGFMPFDETTIYPFTYSTINPNFTMPIQILCLRGKNVCVKVKSITDGKIILSRKDNMFEAFEHISLQATLPFNVTGLRTKAVYGDVGHGIAAKIYLTDLCKCRIRSVSEICKVGDSFVVSVLGFDELKRLTVSYKNTFPEYNPNNYKNGDIVTGTINEPVDNNFTGLFVNVSPQVVGILDYHSWHPALHYGDVVECVVSKASAKGLRLRFLKVLETTS